MSYRTSLLSLSACCILLACSNTGAPERNYGPLLKNLTENVILPEHQDFDTQADALVVAVQALSDKPSADNVAAAQAAWREARRAWRVLDAVHIGPELTLHIAERIDVTPVDAAGIEAIVTGTDAVDDQAVADAGGKKKGFLALEYLLWPDSAAINDTPAPALANDDAAPRRRTWAISIADEIAKSAHQLDDAWEPSSGNYAEQLELAGAGGTQYATQRAAVDDLVAGGVANALEYIVGVRLALPLGRKTGTPDPTQDPTLRSDSAVADIQASLSGVAALYQGDGFSSVVKVQNNKLDSAVTADLEASKEKLAAIPSPFGDAVVNDTKAVQEAYDATKTLKDTWNTDLSSALGAIPQPSDIDGD
jgi:predicted lipoprotein